MHVGDTCARANSWSDTGRVKGPTGSKGKEEFQSWVSGPAEDLRPVSEVEAGVNFRPAGGVRRQVAVSLPRKQPRACARQQRVGVVTPSLHPEVPGIQLPGRGLGIRQSMGWTKVCETARSGIWVLKGNARTRMLPAILDHLRVEWRKQGTYETAWVTPGHDSLCPYKYGQGAAVRPQTNDAMMAWCYWFVGQGRAPSCRPGVAGRELPTGVNLNRNFGPSSCIRWHSDYEPLFGPQNSPKLIISLSLGNSVEFKVRRRSPGKGPSSIRLDHGDILVMDGLAQLEYEQCTASGLHRPRVGLTYRWVAQHTASCPLAGVVGCVLPTCAQGLVEPNSRWLGEGENKWSSSWGLVLFLLILVSFLMVSTGIFIKREASSQWSASIPLSGVLPLAGSCPLGWETALATVTTSPISKESVFLFPFFYLFGGTSFAFFFKGYGFLFCCTAEYASSEAGTHSMLP